MKINYDNVHSLIKRGDPNDLDRLAYSCSSYARQRVAECPRASLQTLERLADDEDLKVIISLKINPGIPDYILDYINARFFINDYDKHNKKRN
jgi:hypothetical protein